MAKKKKKKNKKESISILEAVDNTLNVTYDTIMDEIEQMQYELNLADQKCLIKQRKKMKKDKNHVYDDSSKIIARKEMVEKMECNNFLDRVQKVIKELSPIVTVIARLVASLIVALLSLDTVKIFISPNTLQKMNSVYKTAMSFS